MEIKTLCISKKIEIKNSTVSFIEVKEIRQDSVVAKKILNISVESEETNSIIEFVPGKEYLIQISES